MPVHKPARIASRHGARQRLARRGVRLRRREDTNEAPHNSARRPCTDDRSGVVRTRMRIREPESRFRAPAGRPGPVDPCLQTTPILWMSGVRHAQHQGACTPVDAGLVETAEVMTKLQNKRWDCSFV